jgi:hypothetical protein
VRAFVKHNGLSLVFLGLFLAALVFQAIAGHADFNEEQDRHGSPRISLLRYVSSSEFGVAVMENWQSEYLQFTLFIVLTVWLLQRGSPESKQLFGQPRGYADSAWRPSLIPLLAQFGVGIIGTP